MTKIKNLRLQMVKEYQCPGCLNGSDTNCGQYKEQQLSNTSFRCENHVPGTIIPGVGAIFLGLPGGFNRVGQNMERSLQRPVIRLHEGIFSSYWNHLNIPTWAMKHNDDLLVRTYSPRINLGNIDVIRNGNWNVLKAFPGTVDVAKFANEID